MVVQHVCWSDIRVPDKQCMRSCNVSAACGLWRNVKVAKDIMRCFAPWRQSGDSCASRSPNDQNLDKQIVLQMFDLPVFFLSSLLGEDGCRGFNFSDKRVHKNIFG